MKNILFVGIGGGAGSILRYLLYKFIPHASAATFPWATFMINITGCFLIGLLVSLSSRNLSWSYEFRILLMTGFCGGFTTFSAFTLESIGLLKENMTGIFILYILGSVLLGLLASLAGIILIK